MASQLKTLYEELGRAFHAKPSDLKKCAVLLSKLKVCSLLTWSATLLLTLFKIGLIEAGLLLPQGDVNLGDLVIARSYQT
jgi:26S proteasome regulatory subunit N12